ncbi:MAG: hypothetical protein B7X59_02910 [Polaromonas sp. 39-63-203]|nr:MAG: hypothetical protein B7Y54_00980 [Polaromonas sp. 35-63-240]OYZ03376.1 MAG: hypothetical protein B7Y42_00825 [Polaromonas sp. 28-63-22]OYZ84992.1 MAG: hypothetical protein B7Y03_01315 [Polaromonas sp. 24-62-144]OZB00158.1 MAG: hypothetical protein B7X59_02910 [Polaromonas sp. 39-63-203]
MRVILQPLADKWSLTFWRTRKRAQVPFPRAFRSAGADSDAHWFAERKTLQRKDAGVGLIAGAGHRAIVGHG